MGTPAIATTMADEASFDDAEFLGLARTAKRDPYRLGLFARHFELERVDDAIPWLKRALESSRYACYFYAHTNLARVYALRGQTHLARKHLEEALKVNPEYEPASEMLRRLSRGTDYVA